MSAPSKSRHGAKGAPAPQPVEGQGIDKALAGTNRGLPGMERFISGMSAGPRFWLGWAAYAALISLAQLPDVLHALRVAPAFRLAVPVWRAMADDWSSVVVIVLIYPAVRGLARTAPPWGGRYLRLAVLHAVGAVAFTIVHVCGSILVRAAIYRLHHQVYPTDVPGAILVELPLDTLIYALTVGGYWAVTALERHVAAAAQSAAQTPGAPPVFDIRDNARIVRTPVDQILAVRSASNYCEFMLRDGRAILMRTTLSTLEAQLAPYGLMRSHRSWLVNLAAVAEIAPSGSGDFVLSLTGGLRAPLSRSYRPAVSTRLAPT
jgi:LytTr DNA-binding domain